MSVVSSQPRRGPSQRTMLIAGFVLLVIAIVIGSTLGRERTVAGTNVNDTQLVALGAQV